jgi:ATP-dependent RNA helicase DHX29
VSIRSLPPRLSYDVEPFAVNIEMISIATSTRLQSEAYVSTIALFALCAGEARDEKVFLRLPPVWRKLWADLLEQREAEITALDKADLKNLRNLLSDRESRAQEGGSLAPSKMQQKDREDAGRASTTRTSRALRITPEQLRTEWLQKSSTSRYRALLPTRQQLPIFEHRERIIESIDAHQVTILCAETGAGKSTQVPAFILENELSSGRNCRILVTQPRRISAISLAKRVSEELGEAKNHLGTHRSLVGYAIRLESTTTSSTRITYATTGVLLRMLENVREFEAVSHLVLDEVHERTLELDLAFIAIKRLTQCRPDLKVILMSATVDATKFSRYFGDAPILTVPGRSYPVEIRYLEDAIEHTIEQYNTNGTRSLETGREVPADDPDDGQRVKSDLTGLDHYRTETRAMVANYDEYRINYSLIANLAAFIASHEMYAKYSRAILIFMPGIAEIRQLHHTLTSHQTFREGWSFNLLHSSFSSEDLEQAFMPPPIGRRKIVIATNIAETGITIPDITAVIDTCKEKTMRFDERRQMSRLTENFTSKSSCRQRRGRAARVQEGLCFHLVTKYRFENLLSEQHVPEMLRLSLQEPALRIKIWGFGDIEETLAQALDPPTSKNIRRAIEALKDVGALAKSEALTPLGQQLARLPLDIWLGKLAILGIVFGCLDAAVTIASIMSSKSPFLLSHGGDSRVESAKLVFQRADSDLLLSYNAYLAWRRTSNSGNVVDYCRKNFLDPHALSQIEDMKVQLLVALGDAGLLSLDDAEKSLLRRSRSSGRNREFVMVPERYNTNNTNDNALTSLIALASYPKLLVREEKGWRNISTNQQVNLAPASVNKLTARPPKWLSFYHTMQTRSKLPTAFDTSGVPELAIITLLGHAEFKMFAGVVAIDGGKIRFRVRTWRTLVALKILRAKVTNVLASMIQDPGKPLTYSLQVWSNLWQKILDPGEPEVKLESVPVPRR